MARYSLTLALAGVILVTALSLSASGSNPDQRQRNLLAVNVALDQGLSLIQRGDFAGAVMVLEKHIAYIDGNRAYLDALRDAYRGQVRQLEQSGKTEEAKRARSFLDILEPVRSVRRDTPTNATRPETPRGETTRAKVEQDTSDPFHPSNRATEVASSIVARAEKAFSEKSYDEAAKLYRKAEQAEPGSTLECGERFGYCRLVAVAQRINRGDLSDSLEDEVRSAMRMSSRLETFGQTLLGRLRSPARAPAVTIKHSGKTGSWSVAETENFRIFHTGTEQTAETAARVAEATRVSMTRKWFNEEPAAWSPRCDIFLHATGKDYAKETGAPEGAPGHSSISLDSGRIVKRRIDLRVDDSNALIGVLPHEATHVVLAGRFGAHHVPRWADEGMAVLSEPRERIDLHLRNLPGHRRDRALFAVSELLRQSDYPESRRIGAFYAQSVSLVEFLTRKKDSLTFTRFVRLGLSSGYESALEQYYGYRSFTELEKDWQAYAFGNDSVTSASDKRTK